MLCQALHGIRRLRYGPQRHYTTRESPRVCRGYKMSSERLSTISIIYDREWNSQKVIKVLQSFCKDVKISLSLHSLKSHKAQGLGVAPPLHLIGWTNVDFAVRSASLVATHSNQYLGTPLSFPTVPQRLYSTSCTEWLDRIRLLCLSTAFFTPPSCIL